MSALRSSRLLRHGRLTLPIGTSNRLELGTTLLPIAPANHIYFEPAKLRLQLDRDGFLYFKNAVPRAVVNTAFDEVGRQLMDNGWTTVEARQSQVDRNGFAMGIPVPESFYPDPRDPKASSLSSASSSSSIRTINLPPPSVGFSMTEPIKTAVCGANVMTYVRQVFGGGAEVLPHYQLDMSPPGEPHGFHSNSIFTCRGTKLLLCAWVPLHDITLSSGPLAIVQGSSSHDAFKKIRSTYGQYDIENGSIHGDGCLTREVEKLSGFGVTHHRNPYTGKLEEIDECPIVTTSFEAGDLVLSTVYTLMSYLTNTSDSWRVAASTYWVMDGDDVGPDPRYKDDGNGTCVGMQKWLENRDDTKKFPRSMEEATNEWGLWSHAKKN